MSNSYIYDENHVVYKGKHYKTVIKDEECTGCVFYYRGEVSGSQCSMNGFWKFLRDSKIYCNSLRKDKEFVVWEEVVMENENDKRSEFEKDVARMILG